MWIYLSSLRSTFGLTPDHPLITDEEFIINRAIRKPDLKVSNFILREMLDKFHFSFQRWSSVQVFLGVNHQERK